MTRKIAWPIVICLGITAMLSACGVRPSDFVPTFKLPDSAEEIGLEPGSKVTHREGSSAHDKYIAKVSYELTDWNRAGEQSAYWVSVIDAPVAWGESFLDSEEGQASLAAVLATAGIPGAAAIAGVVGLLVKRPKDRTESEWNEREAVFEAKLREEKEASYNEADERRREDVAALVSVLRENGIAIPAVVDEINDGVQS